MTNWFSWIVRGTVAASIVAYTLFGDPLLDAWVVVRSIEPSHPVVFDSQDESEGDSFDEDSASNSSPSWKSRLIQQQGSGRFGNETQNDSNRAHQRNHYATLRAFRESVGDKWKSTVQVLDKNRLIALGAIVSDDGWIVTKSSEIPDGTIEVRLHDLSKAEGTVKLRRNDLDLALVKIERSNLTSIQWNTNNTVPVGGWLATIDIRNLPVAIGVMSVANRKIDRQKAVLGVTLGDADNGALVENVVDGSGADRAGVQTGDLITGIDGDTMRSRREVLHRLEGLSGGQRVDVGIVRDGKQVLITAQMMDLNRSLLDPTEMEVNGEISSRSTGFQNIIQHDSVIAPNQCGGPIVDVNGNAVGLNIARAGRVSSYAIPARVASVAINEMLLSLAGQEKAAGDSVAQAPLQSASVRTSTPTSVEGLPTSVDGIEVRALKQEIVLPNIGRRP